MFVKIDKPIALGCHVSSRHNEKILAGYLIPCLRTAYGRNFFIRNANTTTTFQPKSISTRAVAQNPLRRWKVHGRLWRRSRATEIHHAPAPASLDQYPPPHPHPPTGPMVELGEAAQVTMGIA